MLDDHSEDGTADGRRRLAETDTESGWFAPGFPGGMVRQATCLLGPGAEARNPLLVFLDADVRLAPDALAPDGRLPRVGSRPGQRHSAQETVGLLESWSSRLIHFILLGFLPIDRMRRNTDPRFAAGCGQLFITTSRGLRSGRRTCRDPLHAA